MSRFAIRGCLIVALMFSVASGGIAQSNSDLPGTVAPQQQPALPPSVPPPPVLEAPHAERYQVNCTRPKDHDEADLCEQKRQAQAAEDAVWWVAFQTALGVAGFLGVIGSLALSAWAAIVSSRAARSAAEGVELSKKFFIAERRPWLEVIDLVMANNAQIVSKGRMLNAFTIVAHNHGNSPAEQVTAILKVSDDYFKAREFAKGLAPYNSTPIPPGFEAARKETGQPIFPGREGRMTIGWAGYLDGTPQPVLGTMLWIGGYVCYEFSAGLGDYRTPFVYRLQRRDAKPMNEFEYIPASDLIIVWDFFPNPT